MLQGELDPDVVLLCKLQYSVDPVKLDWTELPGFFIFNFKKGRADPDPHGIAAMLRKVFEVRFDGCHCLAFFLAGGDDVIDHNGDPRFAFCCGEVGGMGGADLNELGVGGSMPGGCAVEGKECNGSQQESEWYCVHGCGGLFVLVAEFSD